MAKMSILYFWTSSIFCPTYSSIMILSASPVLRTFSIRSMTLLRTFNFPLLRSKLSVVTPTIR